MEDDDDAPPNVFSVHESYDTRLHAHRHAHLLIATSPMREETSNDDQGFDDPIFSEAVLEAGEATDVAALADEAPSSTMTGSIHELQEEAKKLLRKDLHAVEAQMGAMACSPSTSDLEKSLESLRMHHGQDGPRKGSPAKVSRGEEQSRMKNEEDDETDDEVYEDAREDVHSPKHKVESSPSRQISHENISQSPEWQNSRKHIFILSEAGKPIFSHHGDEDELAAIMAVMQAMVSYVVDMGDVLRSIKTGVGHIVFLNKGPLILVAVTRGAESVNQLVVQLSYIYNQLLSVLTLTQLTRIFDKRKSFDLRVMIAGSERLLNSLIHSMDVDPCYTLGAVRVLPVDSVKRDVIASSIVQACSKVKNVVFAILIADNHLVTLVRMKRYLIHPADLHLIFNMVNSTESFKHGETWTPICMPKFDSSGFMHAHVSYLWDDCPACLVLLTVDRDIFFDLSEAKSKIVSTFEKSSSNKVIADGLRKISFTCESLGIPEMLHFLYKAKTAAQFTQPMHGHPYINTEEDRLRLHYTYLQLHNRLHASGRPLKYLYSSGPRENAVGWLTQTFELYAIFPPTTSKSVALNAINKLLRWVKKEESTLFIFNAPTF